MATALSGTTLDQCYLSGIFYIVNLSVNIYTENINSTNVMNIVKHKFKKKED